MTPQQPDKPSQPGPSPLPTDPDPQGLYAMARDQTPGPGRRSPHPAPGIAELQPHFPELQIHSLLGQGGMGAVYRAHQPDLGRDVALKVLPMELGRDPGFAERFAREARVLARLDHPHVVPVYNFGQREDWCFLTMGLVDGMNLRQMLQLGRMQPEEALSIVPQICAALGYAHSQGIVHRDIKPENILIDAEGRVRIVDFGLAKLVDGAAGQVTLTGTDQIMGTPQYMAPEQMQAPTAVDHRADIYSLGVVFYEMLTGALPMGRFRPPSASSTVHPRVDDVVLRSLAQAPEDRYQAAQEVEADLEAARDGTPATPSSRAPHPATRLHPGIRRALCCLLALLLVPVGIALTKYEVERPTAEPPSMRTEPPEPPRLDGLDPGEAQRLQEQYETALRNHTRDQMEQEQQGATSAGLSFPVLWLGIFCAFLLTLLGSLWASRGVRGIRQEPQRWHGLTLGIALTWLPGFALVCAALGLASGFLGQAIQPRGELAPALSILTVVLCLVVGLRSLLRESRRIEASLPQ